MLIKKISFHVTKKQLLFIALISVLGLVTATLTLISSYRYMGTSMATTLHFIYPVLVALICFIFFKEKLSKYKIIALLAAVIGICFFFQNDTIGSNTFLGIFLSIFSGLAYAFYMVGLDKSHLRTVNSMVLTLYVSVFAASSTLLIGGIRQNILFALPIEAYFFMLCNSIFISFCAIALLQIGVKYLSATTAAIFCLFEPVTSNMSGIFFMGEAVTPLKIMGSMIILCSAEVITLLENPSVKKTLKISKRLYHFTVFFPFYHKEQVYKPGSVVNGHLSWYTVASIIMRLFFGIERAILLHSFRLASGGVYIALSVTSQAVGSYPTFPSLPMFHRRSISVALSLESPPPAVNWHPAL